MPAAADKATIAVPSDGGGCAGVGDHRGPVGRERRPDRRSNGVHDRRRAGSAVHAAMVPASSPASATPGADALGTPLGAVDPETSTAGDPLAGVFQDDPDAV